MVVPRRVRKKSLKSVQSEALQQQYLRLVEENAAANARSQSMVCKVFALATCLKECSSDGWRPRFEDRKKRFRDDDESLRLL